MGDSMSRSQALSPEVTVQDELVVAVGKGDESAFALIYERLAGTVLGVAHRILRDPAEAEEVTRDIFVELWHSACRYSPDQGGAFEWVMAMAHRHVIDHLRSAGAACAPASALDQVTDTVETPAGRGLEVLPPLQRESVELAYYRGLTYTEIGDVHSIPAGTVKTLLRDALINLRDHGRNGETTSSAHPM